MAQFEYVTTLASFVVAFGVARLLAGWAHQYVQRTQTPMYPLQVAVSALMLLGLLQNSWAMWFARSVTWTFGTFLLMILTQLALVGASALIHPPANHSSSIQDYYFGVRHAVFGLCAAWVVLGGIMDFIFISTFPIDMPLAVIATVRAAALCIFVVMAWSDKPAYHWAGFAIALLLQAGWIVSVTNNPGAV